VFERYTEKARRVIFFARYEASQCGSPVIETEHLLLGILRETKHVVAILPLGAPQSIRAQIEARIPSRPNTSTSIDLPLSNASKRILAYGAEEAERLKHRYIGSEHLFLGLLREKGCFAAELLEPFGVKLEQLRSKFEGMSDSLGRLVDPARFRNIFTPSEGTLDIHGSSFTLRYVRGAVRRLRGHMWLWQKATWQPRDVVIQRKSGKLSFDLNLANDAENFEVVKGGWTKDYCAICRWELFAAPDDHGTGYTNGRDWICMECYERFWDRPDFISGSYSEIT
jgi:hypothetical protein